MCKKILYAVILSIGLSGLAFAEDFDDDMGGDYDDIASNPGIYFGAQVGTANMHYSGSSYTNARSVDDTSYGFASRGFLGYAFSQFISLELGYDYYGRPKFKHLPEGNTQDILQQGLDLVLKANLPLDYGFALYIKGGFAWVHRSTLHSNGSFFAYKEDNDKFPPMGAIGINYWFAPNIALDLCWAKTVSVSDLPTIDLFTLGLIYRINL